MGRFMPRSLGKVSWLAPGTGERFSPHDNSLLPIDGANHGGKGMISLVASAGNDYKEFFGFTEDPFSLFPNPRFFFSTPNLQYALKAMDYGITQRRGFLLVTGGEGMGKTAFIQRFLRTSDRNIKTIPIWTPPPSFDHFLESILHGLNLPKEASNKSALWRQFTDHISRRSGHEENLVIMVDNAHELSKEFLEKLEELWNPSPGRLQEVLVGRPEIEDKLNSRELRQLKQRIAIRCRLKPLTEEESSEYIEYRLSRVGGHSSKIFDPEALAMICRHSGGFPGALNALCGKSLWAGCRYSKKIIDPSIVKEILEDSGIMASETAAAAVSPKKRKSQPSFHRLNSFSLSRKILDGPDYGYEKFYGFTNTPFSPQPDPRFFFVTENCRAVWNSLFLGITQREGCTLLFGENGVGKTTLLSLFYLFLSTRGHKVIPLFNPPDTVEEILQRTLQNLGLPRKEESRISMLSMIYEDLSRKAARGETLTVIFDEAQNLGGEILEEISGLYSSRSSTLRVLHVILTGDLQFEKNLRNRRFLSLNQRVGIKSCLLPLTPEASREYLEHRLKTAGSTTEKVFAPPAVNLIISYAGGIPRTLNQICQEALSEGYSQLKERVDPENVREALSRLGLKNFRIWNPPRKFFSWLTK